MSQFIKPDSTLWTGRESDARSYLHEKVLCTHADILKKTNTQKTVAILGYACDEGVLRNQGRIGAVKGPDVIRTQLAKMPNHLNENTQLIDVGTVVCEDGDMEATQKSLSEMTDQLLGKGILPIVLGGGHDVAYGHFKGLRKHIPKGKSLGIINFDAHFDLRSNKKRNNSGTPFYQIAQDCQSDNLDFNYLCLGIRKNANDKILFETADQLKVFYIEEKHFNMHYLEHVQLRLMQFIEDVDHIYTTIDLDGFSSAFAPGVSAASPMGFSPDIVLECLKLILDSQKLISLDIAEMNPKYDVDHQTAKLAASLAHYVIHNSQEG
ncbi:formimidoylglutamase [Maribacter sp. 2304DJ31-5]|uniref:formimidoylglutamase n=1 Tax=Maribacter sp. 2304DJ31-5 TaxID=3386273 RepID=UPI0039BD8A9B